MEQPRSAATSTAQRKSRSQSPSPVRRVRKSLPEDMASLVPQSPVIEAARGVELEEKHFWIGNWGDVRSVLTFDAEARYEMSSAATGAAPAADTEGNTQALDSDDAVSAFLNFYDYRGVLFQQARIECPAGTEVDLQPFLSACRMQGGIRHCHLEVLHSVGIRARCFLRSSYGMLLQSGEYVLDEKAMRCLPVSGQGHREVFVLLTSMATSMCRVKFKLLSEKRNPEGIILLRPQASAFISIASLFREAPEFASLGGRRATLVTAQQPNLVEVAGENLTQYLRLSMRGSGCIGVGLLELRRSHAGTEFMCGIA